MWRHLPSSASSYTCGFSFTSPVINLTSRGRPFDIFSCLLKDRILWINGLISDDTASLVVSKLLFLESKNRSKPIHLYINSPGGFITSGLAIYDTIQYITPPVATLCIGQAASMGSLLLAAGAPGKRRTLHNSRIMVNQPSAFGIDDQAVDIAIQAKEIIKNRERLKAIYNKHTGQPLEKIEKFLDRGTFLSPEEAKELGIVDEIIEHRPIALGTDDVAGESGGSSSKSWEPYGAVGKKEKRCGF